MTIGISGLILTIAGIVAAIFALLSDELKRNDPLRYSVFSVLFFLTLFAGAMSFHSFTNLLYEPNRESTIPGASTDSNLSSTPITTKTTIFAPTSMPDGSLFSEDFERKPAWADSHYSIRNSLLVSEDSAMFTPLFGDNTWKNYSVTLKTSCNCTRIFINVRVKDLENFMAYECKKIDYDSFSCYWLKSVDGNLQQIPSTVTTKPSDSVSTITVEAERDNSYRVVFDNFSVYPFVDENAPHFTEGAFQLSLYGESLAIDSIEVQRLP